MGYNGPPGASGSCNQGRTYANSRNQVCGGNGNWGETGVETWREADEE